MFSQAMSFGKTAAAVGSGYGVVPAITRTAEVAKSHYRSAEQALGICPAVEERKVTASAQMEYKKAAYATIVAAHDYEEMYGKDSGKSQFTRAEVAHAEIKRKEIAGLQRAADVKYTSYETAHKAAVKAQGTPIIDVSKVTGGLFGSYGITGRIGTAGAQLAKQIEAYKLPKAHGSTAPPVMLDILKTSVAHGTSFVSSLPMGAEVIAREAWKRPEIIPAALAVGVVGSAKGAYHDPLQTAADIVVLGGMGKGVKGIAGRARFIGKKYVPAKTIIEPRVLRGIDTFPTAKAGTSPAKSLVEFRTSQYKLPHEVPGSAGWHATATKFAKRTESAVGQRPETAPGLHVAPSTSPHFLRIPKGYKLFGESQPSHPGLLRVSVSGFERIPASIRAKGEAAMVRHLYGKAEPTKAHISPARELGKLEKEAIIPPGAALSRTPFRYYTKVGGKRIPIYEYTVLPSPKATSPRVGRTATRTSAKYGTKYERYAGSKKPIITPVSLAILASRPPSSPKLSKVSPPMASSSMPTIRSAVSESGVSPAKPSPSTKRSITPSRSDAGYAPLLLSTSIATASTYALPTSSSIRTPMPTRSSVAASGRKVSRTPTPTPSPYTPVTSITRKTTPTPSPYTPVTSITRKTTPSKVQRTPHPSRITVPPLPPGIRIPTIRLDEDDDKKRKTIRKARGDVGWHIKNPMLTLESFMDTTNAKKPSGSPPTMKTPPGF